MSRKAGASAHYDADDFDDDDDYDDYDDGYDAYDDTVGGNPAKGSHGHKAVASKAATKAAAPHKPLAPAAAAGASVMAQCLSDPPPLRPGGRPQRGAATHVAQVHQAGGSYPLSPASGAAGFGFTTPSPDDRAKAAGPSGRPTVGLALAPSKTPTVRQQQAAAAARKQAAPQQGGGGSGLQSQHSIDAALHDLGALQLSPTKAAAAAAAAAGGEGSQHGSVNGAGAGAAAGSGGGGEGLAGAAAAAKVPYRPLQEYRMERDLERDVAAAVAAEAANSTSTSSSSGGGGGSSRRGLHLVVMGHVDAGKSTLMGRLLHELGHVSQKEVHKNQKEAAQAGKASFSWAWVLDERPEERARGVTVDVALAHFATPGHDVTLLDAPGHRDFVPNMISGAALADAALLLVDGSPGGFEAGFGPGAAEGAAFGFGGVAAAAAAGGQTREHAQLARSLGVEQLAVVVSKLDTCGFSQERFEHIRSQLAPFLKSVGFKEAATQWLPAVGPLGLNLTAPPSEPQLAAWWHGPTLVQAIDAFVPKPRNTGAPLRLPVQDVFKGRQGGVGVGGKLEAGALKPGSRVLVVPGYATATVKSMDANGQDHARLAMAGDSADLLLSGIDASALHQGYVLCHPEFPVRLAVKLTAQVRVLEVGLPLLKGHAVTIHAHTAREAGVISHLVALCDARTGEVTKQRPRCLLSGQTALVEVTPVRPLPLEVFADLKALGRVALREGGRTVAVGIITQVHE